ncbi:MAG: MATE family efflux transporter, partial [Burkholderiales bacterium]
DPAVLAAGESYLRIVGPFYPFIGVGVALYFASQGVGLVGWPVLAGTARLAIALGGGWIVLALGGGLHALYIMIAIGLIAWGALTAVAVARTRWGQSERPAVSG